MEAMKRNLDMFRKLFVVRADVYGAREIKGERAWQVKNPLTDAILLGHLLGRKPVGVYSLMSDGTTKWVCIDIDHDNFAAVREFVLRCEHYCLPVYVERSKSKGFHIWGFFQNPVPARKARSVFKNVLVDVEMETTELFPKQSQLKEGGYGNFVWLPLSGYLNDNGLARNGRTVFVDEHNIPYRDQFEVLRKVEFISEEELDRVIEVNDLESGEVAIGDEGPIQQCDSEVGMPDERNGENDFFWAPPCLRRILREGVSEGIRNESCFRLAILLYRVGIPRDLGRVMLERWNLVNQPPLVEDELEIAVQQAYSERYTGYGCGNLEAYCSSDCRIYEYRKKKGWL